MKVYLTLLALIAVSGYAQADTTQIEAPTEIHTSTAIIDEQADTQALPDGATASEPLENEQSQIETSTTQLEDDQPHQTRQLDITNVELVEHALYSSIVLGNLPAIDKLLPIYKGQHDIATDEKAALLVNLGTALLADDKGDYATSIRIYREVIAKYPKRLDIRLQLAKALFIDQQNEAAKDQFLRLRSEEVLRDEDRAWIDRYLAALAKRSQWNFSGGFTYVYEPNVNGAPKKSTLEDPNGGIWAFPEPKKAHGLSYYFTADRAFNIKNNWYAKTDSYVSGRSYWSNHEYDDLIGKTALELLYKNTNTEFSVGPYYQKRWSDKDPYSREHGVAADWSHWLGNRHQLLSAAKFGKETYEENPNKSGDIRTLNGSYLFVRNARQYWVVGLGYAKKEANAPHHSYHSKNLRLAWTQEWGKGLSTSLAVQVGKSNYAGKYLGILRMDNEWNTSLSVWHRNIHYKGITPKLTFSYDRTKSNHPFYDSERSNTYIQFSKRF